MTETEINNAFSSVGAKYVNEARHDVRAALHTFKDLNPAAEYFTFADGNQRKVVALSGTIPVLFSGSTYNIPVCLYLLDTHPYHPPICYVRPTADMMIQPSKHVDNQGRVYLPYLSEWQYPKCSTLDLLQVMAMIFQDTCPVYSRKAAPPSSSAANLPYPTGATGMPQPGGRPPSFNFGQPQPSGYPPYPPASGNTPYPPQAATNTPYPSYGSQTSAGGTIQPEHFRASLVSAVDDRVRQKLREVLGISYAEVESVRRTKEELERGKGKLQSMLSRLESEQTSLDSALLVYRDKKAELESVLSSAKPADELCLDEAIETGTVLHRQLFSAYVEDCAVEDAIYYLGQALAKGRLDLDAYLRHVRQLSRDQFTLRATMIKCRQKANLPV